MKPKKAKPQSGATPLPRKAPTRLLVCDDQQLIRTQVREILKAVPSIEVVGEAADGRAAVAMAFELKPDVILMDVSMPHLNGIETTHQILSRSPDIRVLAYSVESDEETMRQMFAAGARGYLIKTGDPVELVVALRKVAEGGYFIGAKPRGPSNWPQRD